MIKVKKIGEDEWGRSVYINLKTNRIYKDVDGKLHTSTKSGEPDCPLKEKIEVI